MNDSATHPPAIDTIARGLAARSALPHLVLVDCARRAVAQAPSDAVSVAFDFVVDLETALLTEVINGTGVLLHTNLGRAPQPAVGSGRPTNLEYNLGTGERGSRQTSVSALISLLTGAEAAIVVNNNAAAVMLVLAALAHDRDVAVSRGESVEIGGGFRIPDVMEQSGARLVDVGTTNRTRLKDYSKAIESRRNNIALTMKVHPSNFAIQGFTHTTSVAELATLSVPVVADIGSGLIDNTCPWLHGHVDRVPAWLVNEPAARQALSDGAALVMFSGDKLLGGPQCGIIAGRADLVELCAAHPLMRALRPGGHTLLMLQSVLLSYCARTVCTDVSFWTMVATPLASLESRATEIVRRSGIGSVVSLDSLVGAGSAPGSTLPSKGIALPGDHRLALRSHHVALIARTIDNTTFIDLRSVSPHDDDIVVAALTALC
ncbi:MAG: L-seryl-tRNA(Sec) selenium transferase [Ilumatobacteraceae bacterium]|nr:L-seryl-tRNA(Sec) selenium transferase [Ilumatobacteraceae bacterium]